MNLQILREHCSTGRVRGLFVSIALFVFCFGGTAGTLQIPFNPPFSDKAPSVDVSPFWDTWRRGLSHRNVVEIPEGQSEFPRFASAKVRGYSEYVKVPVGLYVLLFPLEGVCSGVELREPVPVSGGQRYRFQVKLACKNLRKSRFRFGIFWEKEGGELCGRRTGTGLRTSRWFRGTLSETEWIMEGLVPGEAERARPYFFLDGAEVDLDGGVWVTKASFEGKEALTLEFERSLLVFPYHDPVRWRLRSYGLEPDTYTVTASLALLKGPRPVKAYPKKRFRVYVPENGRLFMSKDLHSVFSGERLKGGRYELSFVLRGPAEKKVTRRLRVRFAKLGNAAEPVAGEANHFITGFSAHGFLSLAEKGMLGALVEEMPVLYGCIRFEKLKPGGTKDDVCKVFARLEEAFRRTRWYGSIPPDSIAGKVPLGSLVAADNAAGSKVKQRSNDKDIGSPFGGLGSYISEWEIGLGKEGGAGLDRTGMNPGSRSLPESSLAGNVLLGSKGQPEPWADFFTLDIEGEGPLPGRAPLQRATWINLEVPGEKVIPAALRVLAAGGRAVLLPDAKRALLECGAAGESPKELYGMWRMTQGLIGGGAFVGRVPRIEGAETFCFKEGGREIIAFYAGEGPVTATMEAEGAVTEIDHWGNRKRLEPEEGKIKVRVTGAVKFLTGLYSGVRETVRSFRVKEAKSREGGGVLTLCARNLAGEEGLLSVTEKSGGVKVTKVLPEGGEEEEFEMKIPPESAERMKRKGAATFRVAWETKGKEEFSRELRREFSWGRKRFEMVNTEVTRSGFRFTLRYLGGLRCLANVFVTKKQKGVPRIGWRWADVLFESGEERVFKGLLRKKLRNPLEVIVVPAGNEESTEFEIQPLIGTKPE